MFVGVFFQETVSIKADQNHLVITETDFPWAQDVNRKYMRRSENVQKVLQEFTLCAQEFMLGELVCEKNNQLRQKYQTIQLLLYQTWNDFIYLTAIIRSFQNHTTKKKVPPSGHRIGQDLHLLIKSPKQHCIFCLTQSTSFRAFRKEVTLF